MDDSPIQTALCVIGHPIGGNPTQFVVARALASLGLDWQFVSFDVDPSKIEAALAGIDSLGFCGAIIAEPYQTDVAKLVAGCRGIQSESSHEAAWHDFVFRNDENELVLSNLSAVALKQIIVEHEQSAGVSFESVVLLGEESQLRAAIVPFAEALPVNRSAVAGTSLVPWGAVDEVVTDANVAVESPENEVSQIETTTETSPTPIPTLVIWALGTRPTKKQLSKSTAPTLAIDFIDKTIGDLHSDSLCIDLSGTAPSWVHASRNTESKPLRIVGKCEVDVRRLAIAIHRWTTRDPNLESMREAMEEYLEV